ncbi:MAG: DNA internalization-related competence protein ComEC/Rec2 [Anaerovibrio sp.]
MGQHPKGFINGLLVLLCMGIGAGHVWHIGREQLSVVWCLLAMAVPGAVFLLRRSSKGTWAAFAVAMLLLGLGRYGVVAVPDARDISHFEGKKVKMSGVLAETPQAVFEDDGRLKLRYVVEAEQLSAGQGKEKVSGRLVLYANGSSMANGSGEADRDGEGGTAGEAGKAGRGEEVFGRAGDRVAVSGTVRALHDYGNPGRMNREMTYFSQGIHARMTADKYSLKLQQEEGDWYDQLLRLSARVRAAYLDYMERAMSRQDAAAIFAMLFGGYQGIKPELLEAFTATGIVHILSVSGSHITLMAGTAGIIGRLLHLPGRVTTGLAAVTILFYSLLAGAIPPVIRSALMGLLTLLALAMGRERDAQHILGLTALGLLIYAPPLLYDISFQLSFGATAGLLYIAPVLRGYFRKRLPVFIADSLAVTIGAQVSVLPVIAWYFNVISFSSLLANLVITPIVELIIVVGLLAGLAGSLLPFAGRLVFMGAGVALGAVYELSRLVAALPFSQVYVPSFGIWGCLMYYGALGWLLLPSGCRGQARRGLVELIMLYLPDKWRSAGKTDKQKIAVLLLVLLLFIGGWKMCRPGDLQVHFIDVGQGDAALVITPHGHAFMVDAGGVREGGYDIGRMVDVPYLLHYGVRQLDYIFLTHAHDDHAAGVRGILGKIPVKAVMTGHEGAGEYLKVFGRGDAARLEKLLAPLRENTSMELDGVRIEILYSPDRRDVVEGNVQATGNEFSNLIRVSYGNASFLFTGDLVTAQEAELLRRGTQLGSTVLKVGHHGSRTSSSEAFLQAVNPRWAVISCGYANSFGHPHKEIVQRISDVTGAELLRTDEKGAIVFRTDGKSMKVECYRD